MKAAIKTIQKKKKVLEEPKTYLSINKKLYRAIDPQKAISVAKNLKTGEGTYKVRVVYGQAQISKRKKEAVENYGKFSTAKDARMAILAFLDEYLWMSGQASR